MVRRCSIIEATASAGPCDCTDAQQQQQLLSTITLTLSMMNALTTSKAVSLEVILDATRETMASAPRTAKATSATTTAHPTKVVMPSVADLSIHLNNNLA